MPADVPLGLGPLDHVRVMQIERGAFGADPWQVGEVVAGGGATGGPFEGVAVAPGVVDAGGVAVAVAADHVVDEGKYGCAEEVGADGGDGVEGGEAVAGLVVGVAAGHALVAEPVLYQEGQVEA